MIKFNNFPEIKSDSAVDTFSDFVDSKELSEVALSHAIAAYLEEHPTPTNSELNTHLQAIVEILNKSWEI